MAGTGEQPESGNITFTCISYSERELAVAANHRKSEFQRHPHVNEAEHIVLGQSRCLSICRICEEVKAIDSI
jgi:hypothetical protein